MTTPFRGDRPQNGELNFVETDGGVVIVEFAPTRGALRAASMPVDTRAVRLAEADRSRGLLRIFPVNTIPTRKFLRPKYHQVMSIVLPFLYWQDVEVEFNDLLSNLPRGLLNDPQYGLGLPKEYAAIIEEIESLTTCTELVLSQDRATQVDGTQFVMAMSDFESIRAEFDRISSRGWAAALRVKHAFMNNAVAPALGLPQVDYRRGTHPATQFIADEAAQQPRLAEGERELLLQAAIADRSMAERGHAEFLRGALREVEVANLDSIIASYTDLLTRSHLEEAWQTFFRDNPFALQAAFGYPITVVQEQASVGGMTISGRGEKIADFLLKNSLTGNVAVFEIKTPKTPLLRDKIERGGVYGPAKELGGGITQVLDQKYQLEKRLVAVKDSSRLPDLEQFSIRACLLIGSMPTDPDRIKSFELFRGNLRGLEILTYDELLGKLQSLRSLLGAADKANGNE